ncbi:hypothetical protein EDB83DRAFT_2327830 [Lactarius deliciosus]|nr:hypothetical protein EDB83DRAFT_2327830 [Lactarius deliciosus]
MPSRHMTRYHADQLLQTPVVTAPKHSAQVPSTANATCKSPPPRMATRTMATTLDTDDANPGNNDTDDDHERATGDELGFSPVHQDITCKKRIPRLTLQASQVPTFAASLHVGFASTFRQSTTQTPTYQPAYSPPPTRSDAAPTWRSTRRSERCQRATQKPCRGIDDKDDGSKDQDSDTDNTTASDTGNTDDDLTIRVNMQYMEFFLCKPEPGLPSQALSIVVIEDLKSSQNPTANRGKLRPTKFSYFSLAIATVCVTYEASQTRRHGTEGVEMAQNDNNTTDNRSHDVSTLATVLSTPTIPIPNDRAITSSGTLLENVRLIHESNQCMSKGRLRLHYPRARCEPYSTPPVHSDLAHTGHSMLIRVMLVLAPFTWEGGPRQ